MSESRNLRFDRLAANRSRKRHKEAHWQNFKRCGVALVGSLFLVVLLFFAAPAFVHFFGR